MTVTILDLTGKQIMKHWFLRWSHIWPSVSERMAEWFECAIEDVGCDDNFITVCGQVVAQIEH